MDFVLDIRPGDEFFALVEEEYLNGEFIGFGDIVSARFVNQGRAYTAVRYPTEDGISDYFDARGLSMRKAFLTTLGLIALLLIHTWVQIALCLLLKIRIRELLYYEEHPMSLQKTCKIS